MAAQFSFVSVSYGDIRKGGPCPSTAYGGVSRLFMKRRLMVVRLQYPNWKCLSISMIWPGLAVVCWILKEREKERHPTDWSHKLCNSEENMGKK